MAAERRHERLHERLAEPWLEPSMNGDNQTDGAQGRDACSGSPRYVQVGSLRSQFGLAF